MCVYIQASLRMPSLRTRRLDRTCNELILIIQIIVVCIYIYIHAHVYIYIYIHMCVFLVKCYHCC